MFQNPYAQAAFEVHTTSHPVDRRNYSDTSANEDKSFRNHIS